MRAIPEIYWRSLRFFGVYRLVAALLLALTSGMPLGGHSLLEPVDRPLFAATLLVYAALAVLALVVQQGFRRHFNLQLTIQVGLDIAAMSVLIHAGGGLRSGIGVLLLVSLAAAGLVGQGRLVLFYAAVASIVVLLQQMFFALKAGEFDMAAFFQAGALSAGFFASAVTARLLARRVVANEELARQRGEDLQRQFRVSEQVIAQMQDGVLVVDNQGKVRHVNPMARWFLAAEDANENLALVAPGLANSFLEWRAGAAGDACEFRGRGSGRQIHARFVPVGGDTGDTLVFLEDVGKQREAAQQLKLAALGRLTANIAHEIRNPLSAIRYAAELLRETTGDSESSRLIAIQVDNTHRLERIVSDVLQLGKRDRTHRELIDLAAFLPPFADEFVARSKGVAGLVDLSIGGSANILFDRSHLHQVLWNLLGNALRYGRGERGSIRLSVEDDGRTVKMHVRDDGPGVEASMRGQLFEPFVTAHAKGTGLGLYIARELCEANGARLEYLENSPGAQFCISVGGER